MRFYAMALLIAAFSPAAGFAQTAPVATPTAPAHYSTAETEIGTLLDDPAAKALVEKNIPGLTTNDQIDMARGMTLKAIQQYSPDTITDAKLAALDTEFAKLPAKK